MEAQAAHLHLTFVKATSTPLPVSTLQEALENTQRINHYSSKLHIRLDICPVFYLVTAAQVVWSYYEPCVQHEERS